LSSSSGRPGPGTTPSTPASCAYLPAGTNAVGFGAFAAPTAAIVVAWWTSSPTYLDDRVMRAAPRCGPWDLDHSVVAARDVLSVSVRHTATMGYRRTLVPALLLNACARRAEPAASFVDVCPLPVRKALSWRSRMRHPFVPATMCPHRLHAMARMRSLRRAHHLLAEDVHRGSPRP
jgi:hypothetical protein